MNRAQLVVMWLTALGLSVVCYMQGVRQPAYNRDLVLGFGVPIVALGSSLFLSLGDRKSSGERGGRLGLLQLILLGTVVLLQVWNGIDQRHMFRRASSDIGLVGSQVDDVDSKVGDINNAVEKIKTRLGIY